MSHPVIAIDGTAASGKSTFSRELARRLGYTYVNTGAMYRGVTWHLQQKGIPLNDAAAVAGEISAAGVETRLENGELAFRIAGVDPLPHVREARVNEGVSLVSQVAAVRKLLVAQQQQLAEQAPLVMEGRDIGTVVFPQTPYKFFLDADADVRAQRRSQQGETDAIRQRDALDSQRKESPLTCAPDAMRLDSGRHTVDELVATALTHLATLGLKAATNMTPAKTYFTVPEHLQKNTIPLWNGPAPHSLGATPDDIPSLTVYLPEKTSATTPAIVICPGGGYGMLAFQHEGIAEAEWFQSRGVAAFILKYRLPVHGYRHPVPLLDAQRAVRLVRSRAAEWNVNPAQIAVMGFSAGGHLITTLETHFDAGNPQAPDPVDRQSCRPDYAVPVYALISMKGSIAHKGSLENLLGPNPDPALIENLSNETQVTPQTPPTLLVHAADDSMVSIEHSRVMLAALQKAGVPAALHEYPTGEHGFGYGTNDFNNNAPANWLDRVYDWLKGQGFSI